MSALIEQCKREQETLEMLEVNEDMESDTGDHSPEKVDSSAVVPYTDYNTALLEAKKLLAEIEADIQTPDPEDESLVAKTEELKRDIAEKIPQQNQVITDLEN